MLENEPERYYDWMVWKFRQERKKREMSEMPNIKNWSDDAIDRVNREIAEFHDLEDQMNQLPTPQEDEAWRHKEMMQPASTVEEQYLERTIEILEENINLMRKKSSDYNNGIADKEYYPFGYKSFYTILITKLLRYKSVMEQDSVNYESATDSLRDLINYAARAVVYHEREGK